MDWIGNKPKGVALTFNFKKKKYWTELFKMQNMEILYYNEDIKLYNKPLQWIFGRKLHFIVLLKTENKRDVRNINNFNEQRDFIKEVNYFL